MLSRKKVDVSMTTFRIIVNNSDFEFFIYLEVLVQKQEKNYAFARLSSQSVGKYLD